MVNQSTSGSDSERNLAARLESLSSGTKGVTIDSIQAFLKGMPERLPVEEFNQIINFASHQVGIWAAEYLFSPANSPHIAAKAESEEWKELWKNWSDMLLKLSPDIGEQIHNMHQMVVLQHSLEKSLHYTANKPLRRAVATAMSKAAIWINRLGFVAIAERLYSFSLYPKGSVGRSKV